MSKNIILLFVVFCSTIYCAFSQTEDSLNYEEIKLNFEGFSLIERMPMYPNGEAGVLQYIKENLKYPTEAKKERIEGKVILS
jgi:hypothetical protein